MSKISLQEQLKRMGQIDNYINNKGFQYSDTESINEGTHEEELKRVKDMGADTQQVEERENTPDAPEANPGREKMASGKVVGGDNKQVEERENTPDAPESEPAKEKMANGKQVGGNNKQVEERENTPDAPEAKPGKEKMAVNESEDEYLMEIDEVESNESEDEDLMEIDEEANELEGLEEEQMNESTFAKTQKTINTIYESLSSMKVKHEFSLFEAFKKANTKERLEMVEKFPKLFNKKDVKFK